MKKKTNTKPAAQNTRKPAKKATQSTRKPRSAGLHIRCTDATKALFLRLVKAWNKANGTDKPMSAYFAAMIKEACK